MKVLGIVAEYNPLHNGHIHHIQRSRELTGADVVVCAMSGDYVQRGEPALLDKWTRTEIALNNGVDAVFEIPAYFCLGNASIYASGAIRILESMGIDVLSFGSECGDIDALKRIASRMDAVEGSLNAASSIGERANQSYPVRRSMIYGTLYSDDPDVKGDLEILEKPNNLLGIEYLRNLTKADAVTLRRADHVSAKEIRDAIAEGRDVDDIPAGTAQALSKAALRDDWFGYVRYAVLSTPAEAIERCPNGGEGLANRLKNAVPASSSIDELILNTKSKRYTYSGISRLLMQILLGIDRNEFETAVPQYARILGLNDKGREYISLHKKKMKGTLVGDTDYILTNISPDYIGAGTIFSKMIGLDVKAADIYNLITGRDMYACSDLVKTPVIL